MASLQSAVFEKRELPQSGNLCARIFRKARVNKTGSAYQTMKKDKKVELKHKDENEGVAEQSKQIKKKNKPKKHIDKEVAAGAAATTNGKAVPNAKKDKKKNKNKQVTPNAPNAPNNANKEGLENNNKKQKDKKKKQHKANTDELQKANAAEKPKELTAQDLAKLEKKRAKRLAQKLKKKEQKADNKNENVGETPTKNKSESNKKKINKEQKKKTSKKDKQSGEHIERKERDPEIDAATVFVGNLPINTKRAQVVRHFADYAPVNSIRFRTASGKIIFKHKMRLEAGSLNAYVVLKDAETAERALALNGSDFKGNRLRVTKAEPKSQESLEADAKRTVLVGNLKYSATEEKLHDIFSSCGEIEYIRCLRTADKGCKGVAYVCFKAPESVGLAIELNETMLDERPIHVERYSVKKLGAKQARDEAAISSQKSQKGAKQRIAKKQKTKQKPGKGDQQSTSKVAENAKKPKFHGVKMDALKKKQKKKKVTSQMQVLAKKIAPKVKAN